MENLETLITQKELLEQDIWKLKNSKVIAEIEELENQLLQLREQKTLAIEARAKDDPKLLEEIEFHRSEVARIRDIYFSNTYRIKNLENSIHQVSRLIADKEAVLVKR